MKRIIGGPSLIGLLLLGGCASREARVETALTQAGVPAGLAACLAPRFAERLNNDQLRALGTAAKGAGEGGRASATEIVARVAGIGDPVIVEVVSAAALHCALKG